MPSGRHWLKGRPWSVPGPWSANAWSEGTNDTLALRGREQRWWLFLVWKHLTPLVDSLALLVGRAGAPPHCQRNRDASGHQAKVGAVVFIVYILFFPKEGLWFCTCGWAMSYLAQSSSVWSWRAEVCHPTLSNKCWCCGPAVQCRSWWSS